jgi:hypothetical protein
MNYASERYFLTADQSYFERSQSVRRFVWARILLVLKGQGLTNEPGFLVDRLGLMSGS